MDTDFKSHNFFPCGLPTCLVSHPHFGWAFSSQVLSHMPVLLRNTPQAHPETHITNSRYLSCMPIPEIALAFMVDRKAGVPLNHERTSCIAQVPGECWCSSSPSLWETERSESLQRHLGDPSPFSCWPTPSSKWSWGREQAKLSPGRGCLYYVLAFMQNLTLLELVQRSIFQKRTPTLIFIWQHMKQVCISLVNLNLK